MSKNLKFFKWTGAKTSAAPMIGPTVAELLKDRSTLIVPFAGSLGIVKWLYDNGCLEGKRVIVNDLNRRVIAAWQCVNSPALTHELVKILNDRKAEWEGKTGAQKQEMYYDIRESVRASTHQTSIVKDATDFHFLIRAGFNGLWRESKNGHNVPIGKRANGKYNKMPDWEAVMDAGSWVRNVDVGFNTLPFEDILNDYKQVGVGHHVVIYSDSPYHHSKLQYVKQPFPDKVQQELIDNLELANSYGAQVVYSNSWQVVNDFKFSDDWEKNRIVTKTSIRAGKKKEMVEILGVLR